MPGEQYLPPLQLVWKKYWPLRSSTIAEQQQRRSLEAVAVLVRVGGDRGDAGHTEVERRDVVAEMLAERKQEAAEAAVDVQPDALLERERAELRRSGRSCRSRSCRPNRRWRRCCRRSRRAPRRRRRGVVSGSIGVIRSSTPRRWHALSNAGCAVSGFTTLGRSMPRRAPASRYDEHRVQDAAAAAARDETAGLRVGDDVRRA